MGPNPTNQEAPTRPTDRAPAPRTAVAIVGAGPVGLALALGLARQGIRSVVLERKAATSEHSKAPAIHVRTREILRQWEVERRFLDEGTLEEALELLDAREGGGKRPLLTVDFSDLGDEAEQPGLLILEQGRTEALLLEAVRESGLCEVRFRSEVVGLDARAGGVALTVRQTDPGAEGEPVAGREPEDGPERTIHARYAVGCDGAGSFVRKALGLPFEGTTYGLRPMLGDIRLFDDRDTLPWPRLRNLPGGLSFTVRLRPGLWRLVHLDRAGDPPDEVGPDEVRDHARALIGPGPVDVVWASRFRIHRRSSPRFRVGRVLLAGDAAHVHSPAGGLGMNGGIQDAHNLAWKLARVVGGAPEDPLLDSYAVERKAVMVGGVSRYADILTRAFLQTPASLRSAAFAFFRLAFRIRPIRRRNLRRISMVNLGYPESPMLRRGWRSAGLRLPDLLLVAPGGGRVRLYDLLSRDGTILEVGPRSPAPPSPGVRTVTIGPEGHQDPTGRLAGLAGGAQGWILVRPDLHVAGAWQTRDGLEEGVRVGLRP